MNNGPKITAGSSVLIALFAFIVILPTCAQDPVAPPANLPTIPTKDLIAFYPFNDGEATDSSGNGHDATLKGGASVSTFLTIRNNATDHVTLPHTPFDGIEDFAISVWVRISTLHTGGDHSIISGANSTQDNALFVLYTPLNDTWSLGLNQDGGATFDTTSTVEDMDWHHVVVMRNGSIGRLYLDNHQIGDGATVSAAEIILGRNGLLLGQEQDSLGDTFNAGQSWAGDLDNLRIYNRALSESEISALYRETGWGD
jgi:hypothetical protein